MTRRLGSTAAASLTGSIGASLLLSGLVWPAYEEWSRETALAADEAVNDVLFEMSLPPLRILSAHARSDGARLVSLELTAQARSGAEVWFNDTRLEVETSAGRWTLGDLGVEAMRDADGSLARGLANEGDLLRLSASLGSVEGPLSAGDAFDVWIRCGIERPAEGHARVPPRLTPLVELEWDDAN